MTAEGHEEEDAVIQLPEGSWWDWDVGEWNAGRLRLGAGHDISYAHQLELVFSDPDFVRCPARIPRSGLPRADAG